MKKWYQQKTTWTAITMAVIAVATAFTGLDAKQIVAIETVIGSVALIFLRQGVEGKKDG